MRKRLMMALAVAALVAAMLPGSGSAGDSMVSLQASCTLEGTDISVIDEYSEKSASQLAEFRRRCEAGTFELRPVREDG